MRSGDPTDFTHGRDPVESPTRDPQDSPGRDPGKSSSGDPEKSPAGTLRNRSRGPWEFTHQRHRRRRNNDRAAFGAISVAYLLVVLVITGLILAIFA